MAGAIKQGFFNCNAVYTFVSFLCVQVIFHAAMDVSLIIILFCLFPFVF